MFSRSRACAVASALGLCAASAPFTVHPAPPNPCADNINWMDRELNQGFSISYLVGMDAAGQSG